MIRGFCRTCILTTYIYSKISNTFNISEVLNTYPPILSKLGIALITDITNNSESNDDLLPYVKVQVAFGLSKNLFTQPAADKILDVTPHIFNSVDNMSTVLLSKMDTTSFIPVSSKFVSIALKLGLTSTLILDVINQNSYESISLNQYKIIDPLVKTEGKHGETFIERVVNVLLSNTEQMTTVLVKCQRIYHPISFGCALCCVAALRSSIVTLNSIYGGLYAV